MQRSDYQGHGLRKSVLLCELGKHMWEDRVLLQLLEVFLSYVSRMFGRIFELFLLEQRVHCVIGKMLVPWLQIFMLCSTTIHRSKAKSVSVMWCIDTRYTRCYSHPLQHRAKECTVLRLCCQTRMDALWHDL